MNVLKRVATFANKAYAILALALVAVTLTACGGGGGGGQPPTTSPTTPPTTPAKVAQATLIANPSGFALTAGSSQSVVVEGGSGDGAMTATASPLSVCTATLTANTVNVTGVTTGVCTIAISKDGDGNYNPAETSVSVTVNAPSKVSQSALVATPTTATITVGNSRTVGIAGGNGNGAMSVTASPLSVCAATLTGSTVNVVGVGTGTCTVTVSKDGDSNYNPVSTTVLVTVVAVVNTDTTPPPAPTVSLQNDTTNGGSPSFAEDLITNDPTVKVVGEAGASLRLTYTDTHGNVVVKTTTMPASGSTTVSLTAGEMGNGWTSNAPDHPRYNPALPTGVNYLTGQIHDGTITVTATLTDVAGNVSGATSFGFTLDTVAPGQMDLSLGNPKQVQGLEVDATWQWQHIGNCGVNSPSVGNNWINGNGSTLDTSSLGNDYWVAIRQTDKAGNTNGVTTIHFASIICQ
ncbi:MAG: hypothetical protein QM533_05705 [Cytophagales bacterium]|nr:hypothetical protein [Cytophagales bacterium]